MSVRSSGAWPVQYFEEEYNGPINAISSGAWLVRRSKKGCNLIQAGYMMAEKATRTHGVLEHGTHQGHGSYVDPKGLQSPTCKC